MSLVRLSSSVAETFALAAALADCLQPGDVIELNGPLGAGKTHFVKGLALALGVEEGLANSPTFVLIQEYPGRIPLCHLDAYRLRDVDEFLELGADELLGSDVICLIEWGERVAPILPRDRLQITITVTGESAREFHFLATGPRNLAMMNRLAELAQ